MKQRHCELLFNIAELMTQRGLRNTEALAGGRESPFFDDRSDKNQMT